MINRSQLLLIVAISVCTAVGLMWASYRPPVTQSVQIEAIEPVTMSRPVPSPSPSPKPNLVALQDSPDGSHTLHQQANSIYVTTPKEEKLVLYTAADPETMTLPRNAWSPDNKYVFFNHQSEYVVLPVKPDAEPVLVNQEFTAKLADYELVEVTGWAAPHLLIVNTRTLDGKTGPSFWFNVVTRGFTRLNTLFL